MLVPTDSPAKIVPKTFLRLSFHYLSQFAFPGNPIAVAISVGRPLPGQEPARCRPGHSLPPSHAVPCSHTVWVEPWALTPAAAVSHVAPSAQTLAGVVPVSFHRWQADGRARPVSRARLAHCLLSTQLRMGTATFGPSSRDGRTAESRWTDWKKVRMLNAFCSNTQRATSQSVGA